MTSTVQKNFYDIMKPLFKDDIDLRGKVCLFVNVNHLDRDAPVFFENLSKIYETYKDSGIEIFCFPCYSFGPDGTREGLIKFLEKNNFNVGHIMDECEINGENTPEVYKFLKSKKRGPKGPFILENFTVFVVDGQGKPIERYQREVQLQNVDFIIYQMI